MMEQFKKIAFDYDTLDDRFVVNKLKQLKRGGEDIYIIGHSATPSSMRKLADTLGVKRENVYYTPYDEKVSKIKELDIDVVYERDKNDAHDIRQKTSGVDVIMANKIKEEFMKKLKRKYLSVDEMSGVFAISLVEEAAIELDFVYMSKDDLEVIKFETVNNEERLVSGPIMVPEFWMLRKEKETGEYYEVAFTEETIKECAFRYLEDMNQENATVQHKFDVDGVTLVESWIVNDPKKDKSADMGYSVPRGSWFGTMRINNDTLWEEYVKTGVVKGFSVEGYFLSEFKKAELSEDEKLLEEIKNLLSNID